MTIEKKNSATRNNLFFLKLIWEISPSRVIHTFVRTLLEYSVRIFLGVFFMQYLFGETSRDIREVLLFIWCSVFLFLVKDIYSAWVKNRLEPVTDAQIHCSLNKVLFKKAQKMDISCYETPEFYNTYTKAATEAADRAGKVLSTCAQMIMSMLASSFVIVIMCRITLWSLVFLALPLISNLYFYKKLSRLDYDMKMKQVQSSRCADYVNRVIYFRKYAGELRLTGIFERMRKMYQTAVDKATEIELQYASRKMLVSVISFCLMFRFGFQGMWGVGACLAISGGITLSDFVVLSSAIVGSSWMIREFAEALGEYFSNAMFIENLKIFFNYTPKIDEDSSGEKPDLRVETIEFRNVTFVYPGQEKPVLKNVNLTLKKGLKYALVGINGSGKSTFLKLLLRFYDPTEGAILLNGRDVRELDIKEYRKLIGVSFQDFAMFSVSVTENVLLREAKAKKDEELAKKALKDSGVWEKITSLEYGVNTTLTREFDPNGAELSGGEKQKIAIARAFAKDSPVVLLDEPSSALDPIAEYKMFETIQQLCNKTDRISVIVSHRLSSAAACDKIFLFEDGVLLEKGTHQQLLEENKVYASMFRKQAKNYLVESGGE